MRCLVLLVLLLSGLAAPPATADELVMAARIGPWRWATRPVEFRGRIWFGNATRWPDHNSADVWSIGRDGTGARLERRLFSQDLGRPVVADGLLWWPLEDPRASLGRGEIAVTDGRDWRLLQTRTGRQFHLHGISAAGPRLLVAGADWSAQVLASTDRGTTWQTIFHAPRREDRFSRTYMALDLGHAIAADIYTFGGGGESGDLVQLATTGATGVPGWPAGEPVARLVRTPAGVAALLAGRDGTRAIWQSDLASAAPLPAPPEGVTVDLAVDGTRLHALTAGPSGGAVWRQATSGWQRLATIADGEVQELAVIDGQPVVTGGRDGQGAIWLRALAGAVPPPSGPPAALPEQYAALPVDAHAALTALRALLADRAAYRSHAAALRDGIDSLLAAGLPGDVLAGLLDGPFPEGELSLSGGRNRASHARLGRWVLLNAMRLRGQGRVPPALVAQAFDESANAGEKYFGEAVAAVVAAGAIGQHDAETVAALRLQAGRDSNPDWLRADAREALRRIGVSP